MNKKFLFVGMAAILGASLVFFSCDQGDSGSETIKTVTEGAAADVAGLQKLLEDPNGPKTVTYYGPLAIGNETIVVPAGKTLVVDDGVTIVNGSFIVQGTLTLGTGKNITVSGTGTVIGNSDVRAAVVGGQVGQEYGTLAEATTAFTKPTDPVTVAMIPTAAATDFTAANIPENKTLFVRDTLTLGATPTMSSMGGVVALGDVSVTASVDLSGVVAASPANNALVISSATLTNSAAAKVKLPTSVAVKAIEVGSTDLEIENITVGLTVGSITNNGGNLKLTTASSIIKQAGDDTDGMFTFVGAAQVLVKPALANSKLTLGGNTTLTGDLTLGATAKLELGTGASLATVDTGSTITVGDGTFETTAAAVTFPAGTMFDGSANTVTLGDNLALGEAGLTIDSAGVFDLNGKNFTVVATDVTLTSGSVISSVAGSVVSSTGAGKIPLGSDDNNVTVTKAGLTAAAISSAGEVTIANGNNITFITEGSIEVAGTTAKVSLPNTEFGVGTYTATGAVRINAIDAGDTIVTEGGEDQTSQLAIGDELSLGEAGTAGNNSITYTFKKSSTDKIKLGATANTITIPANTGTSVATGSGANLSAGANGSIVLGDGSIQLERKVSGNGAGSLTLAAGTTIGAITAATGPGYFIIQDGADLAGTDGQAAENVTIGDDVSSTTIIGIAKTIYGATGASTERPDDTAVYASIAKGLSVSNS